MSIPVWLPYVAAGLVILFSISLCYWAFRVLIGDDPLDDVDGESWFSWSFLFLAVLGIDLPVAATIFIVIASFFASLHSWTLALIAAGSAFAATMFYLFADARARRKLDEQRLALKPKD